VTPTDRSSAPADDPLQTAYGLVHDLQGPLAAIMGQLELLERAVARSKDPRPHAERCRAAADRMRAMIDATLAYARGTNEQPRRTHVDACAALRECAEAWRDAAQRAGIELNVAASTGCTALADPALLSRCVDNLLSNAVKFTGARPGPKRIEAGVELAGRTVRIVVRDNGPGIPGAMLEEVFEPFRRGRSAAAGTGLGLATVRALARAMGGRAWIESDLGKGAAAFIELEAAADARVAA